MSQYQCRTQDKLEHDPVIVFVIECKEHGDPDEEAQGHMHLGEVIDVGRPLPFLVYRERGKEVASIGKRTKLTSVFTTGRCHIAVKTDLPLFERVPERWDCKLDSCRCHQATGMVILPHSNFSAWDKVSWRWRMPAVLVPARVRTSEDERSHMAKVSDRCCHNV